jgi:hypothetical protein
MTLMVLAMGTRRIRVPVRADEPGRVPSGLAMTQMEQLGEVPPIVDPCDPRPPPNVSAE